MDILYDILSLARGRHCSGFGGVYAVWAHVIILITNVIIVYRHHHEWHCRVQVNVANLSRDLGYIEYEARESGLLTEEEIIIIGVCVGAACLIILVIVIAVVVQLKRKSTEKDRENRRLLALLFQLESSVRDQCKQGLYSSQSVSSAPLCLFQSHFFWLLSSDENSVHKTSLSTSFCDEPSVKWPTSLFVLIIFITPPLAIARAA